MATTSTQQTNGANTLIVSSSVPLSIPLSSTSQLSSAVNTSALTGSQPSLIANHIQSPFGIQLYPHEFQQQVQLFQQQQQMFLQPQHGLSLQQNLIQTANEQHLNQALVKKKSNKQQKIVSKSSNQLPKSSNNQQLSTVLKSNMITGQPQFTAQNNQAVIINQLPNVQQALANKKILEQHKNKYVIQNNQITQQQIVSPQFKHQLQNNTHLQLTSQSPLINQAQLIAQPIQQPQLTWASNHVQRPIIIGQPTHAGAEGQQLFIQNPGALQAMQGGQFYLNQNQGALMQLVSNPQGNLNSVTAQLAAAQSTNSTPSTPTNLATVTPQQTKQINNSSSTSKLKSIRPASSLQNSSTTNSPQILNKTSKPIASNKLQQQCSGEDSQKKLGKKQQQQAEQERFKKSTQQMNNELILSKNNLQRSESLKSLDSTKSKNEGKLKKQQSSSLDDDSSSLSSNSKLNNSINKKDKSEKKIKQKAIVKPIISHYVGGYIIHESSHPFPINITEELNDELEQIKLNNGSDKNQIENNGIKEGKTKLKKLKKSKSKLSNISNNPVPSTSNLNMKNESKQVEPQNKKNLEMPPAPINKNEEDVIIINSNNNNSSNNNSSDSSDSSSLDEKNVLHWSVEQVYEYLKNHGTSIATAEELKKEKINGRSLVLLTLPMLTKDKFAFKLGPSLSLKKIIDELKGKASEDKIENYLPSSGNSNINDWSVKDTKEFILNLSSEKHAEEFEKQEIDGKSLNLISYDNIINDLNLEFGPALVIYSKIEELKTLSNK